MEIKYKMNLDLPMLCITAPIVITYNAVPDDGVINITKIKWDFENGGKKPVIRKEVQTYFGNRDTDIDDKIFREILMNAYDNYYPEMSKYDDAWY